MSVPSSDADSEVSDAEENNVNLEVKPKGVGRKPKPTVLPEQEGVDKKTKRTMSATQLEKLALARKKALQVRQEKALAKKEAAASEAEPSKKEKPKPKKPAKEPVADDIDDSEIETPKHVHKEKKKKKTKKPIVIVQQEDSSSESDDQVIYIKQPRSRRRPERRYIGDGVDAPKIGYYNTPPPEEQVPEPPPPQKSEREILMDMNYNNMFNSAPSRRRR